MVFIVWVQPCESFTEKSSSHLIKSISGGSKHITKKIVEKNNPLIVRCLINREKIAQNHNYVPVNQWEATIFDILVIKGDQL